MAIANQNIYNDSPEPQEPQRHGQPTQVILREIIETLLLTFFIFWIVNSVVGRYRIDGSSMNPTLQDSQYLLVNNVSYFFDGPQRGDIIVFEHPNQELNLIKRVIGVPGDHIEISENTVLVNDVPLEEPYIQAPPNYSGVWDIQEGSYFVLGDNRNNSSDSHSWNALPEEKILGKAMIVYWPPQDWSGVPHFTFTESAAAEGN